MAQPSRAALNRQSLDLLFFHYFIVPVEVNVPYGPGAEPTCLFSAASPAFEEPWGRAQCMEAQSCVRNVM